MDEALILFYFNPVFCRLRAPIGGRGVGFYLRPSKTSIFEIANIYVVVSGKFYRVRRIISSVENRSVTNPVIALDAASTFVSDFVIFNLVHHGTLEKAARYRRYFQYFRRQLFIYCLFEFGNQAFCVRPGPAFF